MTGAAGTAPPAPVGAGDDDLVVLLRGVNVGGVTIRSGPLRELFEGLGFTGARTILASGNVLCRRPDADLDSVKHRIEAALGARFGYTAWVVLRSRAEVRRARDGFPFDAADPNRQPYLVFCADAPTLAELAETAAAADPEVDPVQAGPGVLYWNPERGASTSSPFARQLARRRWSSVTTTRNIRTLDRILALHLD